MFFLSALILIPLLGALCLLCLPNCFKKNQRPQLLTTGLLIVSCLIAVVLIDKFDHQAIGFQFQEHHRWLPTLGIHYDLGIDGLSLLLILLTTLSTLIAVLSTWHSVHHATHQYLACLLGLQGLLVGVFSAIDTLLFYLFWETTLIPMYLIIGIWGSQNRIYAAIKFFLYTLLGSLLLLASFLYLGSQAGSFDLTQWYALPLSASVQTLLFFGFFAGFAVKLPMWPLHTWLPDAHTEAPAGGSIVLAAILLKLGGYGFLRFSLPILPDASATYSALMIVLSLIAIVYIGFVALVQKDMKKLIAYASISHMGFVTLGLFAIYFVAEQPYKQLLIEGAVFIMLSHGFVSAALFASVGHLYEAMHSRNIGDFSGVLSSMPILGSFFIFFAMANVGLPGTSAFVGEWMIILASMKAHPLIACIAATTLILSAAYTLFMVKRVFLGPPKNLLIQSLTDISGLSHLSLLILAGLVLLFGLYPNPILNVLHTSVNQLIQLSCTSKLLT